MSNLKTLLYSVILSLGSASATRPALAAEPIASNQFVTEILPSHPARSMDSRMEHGGESGDALAAPDHFVVTMLVPQLSPAKPATVNPGAESAIGADSAGTSFKAAVPAPPANRNRTGPASYALRSRLLRAPQAGDLSGRP